MLILVIGNAFLSVASLLGLGVCAGKGELDRSGFVMGALTAVITGTAALYIAGVIR